MSYLKRQKKKELEKFEGIESGGEWELYKTKVDGPGISQPEDAFVVVDAYYNKNCVFEVRKSASGPPQKTDPPTKEVEREVEVLIEYYYSKEDLDLTNLNDMSYVSESAEVVDVEDGVPIIEVNTKSGKQRLKPSDIDKDRSQEVNY